MSNFKKITISAIILTGILLNVFFIPFFGTGDTRYFVKTAAVTNFLGPREAFEVFNLNYPPFSSIILWLSGVLSRTNFPNEWLDLLPTSQEIGNKYIPVKFTIVFVFFLFAAMTLWFQLKIRKSGWVKATKNSAFIFLNPAFILSSSLLGYVDIFIAPFLFLTFYFLQKREYFLTGLLFSVSFLTKLFPIFLLPLFLAYFSEISKTKEYLKINIKDLIQFILGVGLGLTGVFLAYDSESLFAVIRASAQHGQSLSSNAFNLGWIIKELFHYESGAPKIIFSTLKIAFLIILALLSIKVISGEKTTKNLLYVSTLVMSSYFVFFTGVHENHLITALILSSILYVFYPSKKTKMILTSLSFFVFMNLFLFYGIGGILIGGKEVLVAPRTYFAKPTMFLSITLSVFITFWLIKLLKDQVLFLIEKVLFLFKRR